MPYNTKTTITFSFELPLNLDSKAAAETKIKDLVSSGNIKLTLPDGYKNLNLEDCQVKVTGFNSDSRDSFNNGLESDFNSDSDDYEAEKEAALKALSDRICNKHKNSR